MELFDVYKLWPIEPVKAKGLKIWDKDGVEYTDLYGGHAVISIGHCHETYVNMLQEQLNKLGFYSNAVQNSLQRELASTLGRVSGYEDFALFLCNSGAEANENALKLASFHTGKRKFIAMEKAFHGRTFGAVAATDNPKIRAPFNLTDHITFVPLNDIAAVDKCLSTGEYAGVIIEGIQGVAGIYEPEAQFLQEVSSLCKKHTALLILDEVQSGYGRTGKFFAHQHAGVVPDIITTAKGMGNGFPIGGVLVAPHIKPSYGMLGTTFGGNHLACTAALAVLKVIEEEKLVENSQAIGDYLIEELSKMPIFKEVRGRGLMIGMELNPGYETLRDKLLFEEHMFTGGAGANVIRLLPPLTIDKQTADKFIDAVKKLTA
ncbi:MAG: aspartate aminotransferase family protein [Bacteroidales bacterium]|nr:aspartate aminotransferase family protein [Bacteroidales bacterium]MBQ2243333.1 aspartate aminotransferase family protein [Bacteroidales bacterium]